MFGYIRPVEPQLRVCELNTYKAVYCGLCRQLGRSFGLLARFTLSYDTTFLALLGMGLGAGDPEMAPGRCPFHPLRKMPLCGGTPALAFSADMAALVLWWKLRDDLADEGIGKRLLARLGLFLTKGAYRKAAARHRSLDEAFRRMTENQQALESRSCSNVDEAAEPTAAALSAVFAALGQEEKQQRVLGRLGYLLGRFAYLADALDDLAEDRCKGRYNPFLLAHAGTEPEELRRQCLSSLYLTIGETELTYRLLEVRRFGPILENILTLGLMSQADRLAKKGVEKDG